MSFSLNVTSGPNIGRSIVSNGNGSIKFGRNQANDCVLAGDEGVSRQHFEISTSNGRYYIRDLNSRNGTYLNRQSVVTSELNSGDEIRAGSTTMVFVVSNSEPDALMQRAGVDTKARVEFRFGDDEPTVADSSIRFANLHYRHLLSNEFANAYLDLPGKVILLNVEGIRSTIDRELDFETIGQHAVLVFPRTLETMVAIHNQYFGSDSMIFMNHNCRRSKLLAMLNESFDKFAHPTRLVDHIHDLPQEAAAGLMTGIDLAICETKQPDFIEVIYGALHSSWLQRFFG